MTAEPESALQRRLASEFSKRGWSYDMDTVPAILEDVQARGLVVPARAAEAVPRLFLDRNGTTRDALAEAISAAIGGMTIASPQSAITIITSNDNRHQVNVGGDITGGVVQTGGQQIVAQTDSSKEDVLAAITALVRAGLSGHWDGEVARDLGEVIDSRSDVTIEDVREVATDVARQTDADPGRVKTLVTEIATEAAGGTVTAGILAALGMLF